MVSKVCNYKIMLTHYLFKCFKCNNEFYVKFNDGIYEIPKCCPKCKANEFCHYRHFKATLY